MEKKIFINLAVKNLDRSIEFFTKLGFNFNPQFTDATATCMVISEHIYVMLLTEAKFKEFTPKPLIDAKKNTEVLIALSLSSKEEVNTLVDKALSIGAIPAREPKDHGFMFERSIEDLDGHIWEMFWMDPAFANQ